MSETTEINEITVEKLVHGGEGLARVNGRVVFLPYVLPGEVVEVETTETRRDLVRARPVSIKEPSPHRIEPGCRYFGTCSGCQLQHTTYEQQLLQKVAILQEVLQRVGKIEPPEHIEVVSGPEWEYRNRVQLHFENGRLGYREAGSHDLVAIDHCPISSPAINRVIATLVRMMKDERFPRFVKTVEIFTNETEVQLNVLETRKPLARHFFDWCAAEIEGYQPGALEYRAAGYDFRVGRRSFFQVNRFLIDRLVEVALEGCEGESALDLYAGVGLFSLPLAARMPDVTAVEGGTSAVNDLMFNAQRAGVTVAAVRSDTALWLAGANGRYDCVVADPPRSGLGRPAVEQLIRLRPRRLHIIACDPATLARDLQRLLNAGFELERMVIVDLFPQTAHLETVVFLRGE